jgi:hypothetical protein
MSEQWGQDFISARDIGGAGPVPIGGEVSHNVAGAAETFEITKSDGADYLVIRCEAGTHRIRPGRLDARDFVDGDVTVATDQIEITGHGYETGDGPLFLSTSGVLPAGLAADTPYWVVKIDDDFIQLTSNPGHANRVKQTGAGSTEESDAIAVDITAAAGGGTHSLGGFAGTGNAVGFAPVDPPAADLADGGSFPLIANEVILYTGPVITVRATAAADILTWYEV